MPEHHDRDEGAPSTGRAGTSGSLRTVADPTSGPQVSYSTVPPPEPGLSETEVADRVAAGRTNDVPVRASRSVGQIVRGNVFTRINAMIAVLFTIIAVIGPVQDGLFAMVILINTLIGIVQELRAKRTLDELAIVNAARPRVVRGGATVEVATQEIVLDEVLEVGVGDQVVVDGVLTWSGGLEIDESLLTGEADPVVKEPGDTVMSGSFVVAGTGRFRATKVGRHAYAARLAEEASRFSLVRSELRSGIDRMLTWITYAMFPIGALLIYSQLFMGGHVSMEASSANGQMSGPLADALRGMVAALVSMIPEGLILLTSIAFAVGVVRLGKHKCLVQELPAIEGLARVDVVCTDKTGTLTEVGMKLAEIRDLGGHEGGSADDPSAVPAALAASDPDHNASMAAIAQGSAARAGRPRADGHGGRAVLLRAQVERGERTHPRGRAPLGAGRHRCARRPGRSGGAGSGPPGRAGAACAAAGAVGGTGGCRCGTRSCAPGGVGRAGPEGAGTRPRPWTTSPSRVWTSRSSRATTLHRSARSGAR